MSAHAGLATGFHISPGEERQSSARNAMRFFNAGVARPLPWWQGEQPNLSDREFLRGRAPDGW